MVADATLASDRLAALAVLLETFGSRRLYPAELLRAAGSLIGDAVGPAGLEGLTATQRRALLGQIRTALFSNVRMLRGETGWTAEDNALILAAGDAVVGLAQAFHDRVVPALDGLALRLEMPTGAFLNLGAGTGTIALGMARLWPELGIVGVEPLDAARTEALARIRAAGLESRIEMLGGHAEHITLERAFDMAWLPAMFFPPASLAPSLVRARIALKPGGWLVMPIQNDQASAERLAQLRFRVAVFGGSILDADGLGNMGRLAGFTRLQLLSAPATSPTRFAALQAPQA